MLRSWLVCKNQCYFPFIASRKAPTPTVLPTPALSRTPSCGKRHPKRVPRGRILGGTSAMAGSHPWMAALYIGDEFCAGSLVSSCWVVSAAHCFLRKYVCVCVLGECFISIIHQEYYTNSNPIMQLHIFVHAAFSPKSINSHSLTFPIVCNFC